MKDIEKDIVCIMIMICILLLSIYMLATTNLGGY